MFLPFSPKVDYPWLRRYGCQYVCARASSPSASPLSDGIVLVLRQQLLLDPAAAPRLGMLVLCPRLRLLLHFVAKISKVNSSKLWIKKILSSFALKKNFYTFVFFWEIKIPLFRHFYIFIWFLTIIFANFVKNSNIISIYAFLFVFCVNLSIFLSIYIFNYQFINPPIYPSIYLSSYQSIKYKYK